MPNEVIFFLDFNPDEYYSDYKKGAFKIFEQHIISIPVQRVLKQNWEYQLKDKGKIIVDARYLPLFVYEKRVERERMDKHASIKKKYYKFYGEFVVPFRTKL